MPKPVRDAFEQRLVDMRNTVVADLKISNAETVIASLTKVTTQAIPPIEASHVPKPNGSLETSPDERNMIRERQVKRILLGLALIAFAFTLYKSGLHSKIMSAILNSRFVSWLLLAFFNFRSRPA